MTTLAMPPGTTSAVDRLIEDYADRAYAAALRLTGDPTEAGDLVQESFLRALAKAGLYDPAFDFGGWLWRVMYRLYLNRRRARGRRREISMDLPDAAGLEDVSGRERWASDAGQSPEAVLERGETQERVAEALDRLPGDLRACVVLVDIEGRSYEEAAGVLNWPVGSVSGRLFRARRRLRELLRRGDAEADERAAGNSRPEAGGGKV